MTLIRTFRNLLLKGWARIGRHILVEHYIFVNNDSTKLQTKKITGESIHIASSLEEVPKNILTEIYGTLGANYKDTLADLFGRKAKLYVLMLDGEFGSMGWIQIGRNLSEWWVELQPNDFVMFSAITNPELRGHRLWGRILAVAYQNELTEGGQYYADCNVANVPSRRQLERSGFEIVARESHLSEIKVKS